MKPKKMKIEHIAKQGVYEVRREYEKYYDNWFDGEGSNTYTEFLAYAVGDPEDIKAYFEVKKPREVIKIIKLDLNYEYNALEITPELGKKSKEIKNLERKVKQESREI